MRSVRGSVLFIKCAVHLERRTHWLQQFSTQGILPFIGSIAVYFTVFK